MPSIKITRKSAIIHDSPLERSLFVNATVTLLAAPLIGFIPISFGLLDLIVHSYDAVLGTFPTTTITLSVLPL